MTPEQLYAVIGSNVVAIAVVGGIAGTFFFRTVSRLDRRIGARFRRAWRRSGTKCSTWPSASRTSRVPPAARGNRAALQNRHSRFGTGHGLAGALSAHERASERGGRPESWSLLMK